MTGMYGIPLGKSQTCVCSCIFCPNHGFKILNRTLRHYKWIEVT